jgi:hypothetical protein
MIGLLGAAAIVILWVGALWVVNDVRARQATVRAADLCGELSLQHRDCSYWSSVATTSESCATGDPHRTTDLPGSRLAEPAE